MTYILPELTWPAVWHQMTPIVVSAVLLQLHSNRQKWHDLRCSGQSTLPLNLSNVVNAVIKYLLWQIRPINVYSITSVIGPRNWSRFIGSQPAGDVPAVTSTFDLLVPKSNQHEPNYTCDKNWVRFLLLVFEISCSQCFRDAQTHSLTDEQTRNRMPPAPYKFSVARRSKSELKTGAIHQFLQIKLTQNF